MEMKKCFARTNDGQFLVQAPDSGSRWGFYLADDDQTWDGGLGIASEWEAVDAAEVPVEDRERLEWLFD